MLMTHESDLNLHIMCIIEYMTERGCEICQILKKEI